MLKISHGFSIGFTFTGYGTAATSLFVNTFSLFGSALSGCGRSSRQFTIFICGRY